MKKILTAVMIICAAVAGFNMAVYCQDDGPDDRIVDQSEFEADENLSSEISDERAEAESQVSEVDASMDITGN